MTKDLGSMPALYPMPVLMVAAYDENGVPQYRNELKTSSPILDLISDEDKPKILEYLSNNKYKNLCELLEGYKIIFVYGFF